MHTCLEYTNDDDDDDNDDDDDMGLNVLICPQIKSLLNKCNSL